MKWRFLNSRVLNVLFTVALVLLLDLGKGLAAQQSQKRKEFPPARHYTVTGTEAKIKIDGVLDEAAWDRAVIINVPYEWFPGDNIPAPVKTECLVTFSKSKLYMGFRCFDPGPQKVRAHLMDRDAMVTFVQDDHVLIILDTFNDERRGFQFRVNPLGVQADASFSEMEGFEDFSWDAIWDSAGKITDFGYTVEFAVPFNQLRFPRTQEKQTWGISIERTYPRIVRHRLRSHTIDRNRRCILCQMNKITGFEKISPGYNLEFDPTLTINRTDRRTGFPAGEMEKGKLKVEPGISARWGITPNLVLNAAVNPDFSNVEADVAQLEVNTRFALRYPEKRPFFLEGADFFLTPLEAVFSRTVYDPLWGAKMTGKLGRNALGFFVTRDTYNNLLFPSNQGSLSTSLEENVFSTVLRYRRDVGKGSTLGLLYTGRLSDDYYNHVVGADGFMRISRTKTISFQFLHSQTDYPENIAEKFGQDRDAFGGNAFYANFMHTSRNFQYGAAYQDLSPNFRADYGFIPRVDIRVLQALVEPIIWGKPNGWFSRISFILFGERIIDCDGNLTDQDLQFSLHYQGSLQSVIQPNLTLRKEWYNGITYDTKLFQAYAEIKPMGGVRCTLFAQVGDSIDYSNSRLAHTFLIQPTVDFSPEKHLNISLNHTLQRLDLQGEKIYTASLLQAKVVYNFNVRTFVRLILQYMDFSRNPDLYLFPVTPETKTLFTQFLFSYKVNPQTKLFIGYSDNHLGMKGIDLTRTNRTFFLKIGYALVY